MLLNLLLFTVLLICVITDLQSRKIYNKVIFPAILIALLINMIFLGWNGLLISLLGFISGLALLLIPYLMGGMGAGDVKLLALVGAIKGTSFVLYTGFYMAVIGCVIGVLVLLFRKGVTRRFKQMFYSLCGIRYGLKIPLLQKEGLQTTYPYGVAIAAGAVMAFFLKGVFWL
ncbi:prepilin peptidase [Radiobacillus sp. PE A8.2]|uniref:A24 family peptidase n=1 Tax=Radiobacillus sp. PE A8.2 TaxID=3380349 RepID=UPI003890C702